MQLKLSATNSVILEVIIYSGILINMTNRMLHINITLLYFSINIMVSFKITTSYESSIVEYVYEIFLINKTINIHLISLESEICYKLQIAIIFNGFCENRNALRAFTLREYNFKLIIKRCKYIYFSKTL